MKNSYKAWVLAIVLALGIGEAYGQFNWTKDAYNPILSGGTLGTWDRQLFMPQVLYNEDSLRYEMWFGASSYPATSHWRPYRIGFATSKDGITWEMRDSAVLSPTPGTWDSNTVEQFSVMRDSGQYKMWYSSFLPGVTGAPGYIGYATSPNGIRWTKYSGNPVLGPGTAGWEAGGPTSCAVLPVPGGYRMWYAGYDVMGSNSSIGCANSPDGITWQRDTVHNPVLRTGAVKAWDFAYIMNPRVLQIENTYYMWYQGEAGNAIRSIGCATSKDAGITWTKEASNPVLSSSPGTWDASNIEPGGVLLRGDTLHMWYDGVNEVNAYRIGHATSPLILRGITERSDGLPEEFMLAQNYPNPFNPTTGIRFQVSGFSLVKITVFDLLGREVAVLVNEKKTPGSYEVPFDGSGLASGVYFYRLTAASFVQTRKMLLIR